MAYIPKNYTEQGGDKLVIGGEIDFSNAEKVVGNIENQPASVASTVAGAVADLNALIAKLKAAGLMTADV